MEKFNCLTLDEYSKLSNESKEEYVAKLFSTVNNYGNINYKRWNNVDKEFLYMYSKIFIICMSEKSCCVCCCTCMSEKSCCVCCCTFNKYIKNTFSINFEKDLSKLRIIDY